MNHHIPPTPNNNLHSARQAGWTEDSIVCMSLQTLMGEVTGLPDCEPNCGRGDLKTLLLGESSRIFFPYGQTCSPDEFAAAANSGLVERTSTKCKRGCESDW